MSKAAPDPATRPRLEDFPSTVEGDQAYWAAMKAWKEGRAATSRAELDAIERRLEELDEEAGATAVPGPLPVDETIIDARLVAIDRRLAEEDEIDYEPDQLGMPPACPVLPLGKNRQTFYFLTPQRDVVDLSAGEFGQGHIDGLFAGKTTYLYYGWPRKSKNRTGVAYDLVRRSLMDACARRAEADGVFDLGRRVRGRGCWVDEHGQLAVHCGSHVITSGQTHRPGEIGDHVYPAGPSLPPPDPEADAPALGRQLLKHLESWRFARGSLDARLLLGWIAVAGIAGALKARPQVWLLGDPGTGKSSLQAVLEQLFKGRILALADTTAPAIYQNLKHDALAVALDEFENEEDARATAVIKLARIAFSGGQVARGGSDGVPADYQARACFLFSAVNRPPLKHAEATRQALLQLLPLPEGSSEAPLDPEIASRFVPGLLGRYVTHWPLWQDCLARVRAHMMKLGHAGRGADQFGTLLAGAWFATRGDVPAVESELADWCRGLEAETLSEVADKRANWRRCVDHLMAAQPEPWRTRPQKTVGDLLDAFLSGQSPGPKLDGEDQAPAKLTLDAARTALGQAGLALISRTAGGDFSPSWWLGLPDDNQALAALFAGTEWAARRGTGGAWGAALRRAPGAVWEDGRFRLNGVRVRGLLIGLAAEAAPGEPVFVSSSAEPNEFWRDGRAAGED